MEKMTRSLFVLTVAICSTIGHAESAAVRKQVASELNALGIDASQILYRDLIGAREVDEGEINYAEAKEVLSDLASKDTGWSCGIVGFKSNDQNRSMLISMVGPHPQGLIFSPRDSDLNTDAELYSIHKSRGFYKNFPISSGDCGSQPLSTKEVSESYDTIVMDEYKRFSVPEDEDESLRRVKVYYANDSTGSRVLLGLTMQDYQVKVSGVGPWKSKALTLKAEHSCRVKVRRGKACIEF